MTWGDAACGGDCSAVQGRLNVQQVQDSNRAFAALFDDGTVVTWVMLPAVATAVLCKAG